jgi:hypothetical protein
VTFRSDPPFEALHDYYIGGATAWAQLQGGKQLGSDPPFEALHGFIRCH